VQLFTLHKRYSNETMNDQTLITRCLKGDSDAQRLLFEKYAPKMMSVCMRYMRDEHDAQDVLQDGFIKVFFNLKNYVASGTLESWIRKVIVNTALDQLRKNTKFSHTSDIWNIEHKIKTTESTSDQLMADDLIKLIQELPNNYRTVFNLFALEGYSHKEIAEMLKITENTSKSHYFRARAILRTKIEGVKKP